MAETNFDAALAFVLRPENDGQHFHVTKGDPGGATNEGIIWSTFVWWETAHGNRVPTLDEFRNMPLRLIDEIYHSVFWNGTRCPELPSGFDLMMFNMACAGPGTAVRCLQRAVGVIVDGRFGPITMRETLMHDAAALITAFRLEAEVWFQSRPDPSHSLHGWLRRLGDAVTEATSLISK